MRHRRAEQGGIQPAQVARGFSKIKVAADIQVKLAIAHGPAQVHQGHAAGQRQHGARLLGWFGGLGAVGRGARGMDLFQAVLHHAGQVHGQRAGAHTGARTQQQHAAPGSVHAAAARRQFQETQHNFFYFLGGNGGVDKIADASAQRGNGAFRLAQQTHRHARHGGRNARQHARQLRRLEQLARFVFA
ncbi:hypothetical protein D3C72_1721820 [compost metagenome]